MPTPPQTAPTAPDDPAPVPGERRLGVSGAQVATSALASVSAAFVASLFGVAGTIVGAAVVSVVATVGTALYGRGIRRTTARLQQVPRLASRGVGAGRHPADGSDDGAGPGAGGPLESEVPPAGPRWWRRLSRRHLGLAGGVAAVLVLSVGAVSLIELVGGQPLSGEASGGRTSVGALLPGGGGTAGDDDGGTGSDDDGGGDGTATTTDPSGPTTTVTGGQEVRPGTTAPAERGDTATTSSTVPTTATTAPPTTRAAAEPELAPEG